MDNRVPVSVLITTWNEVLNIEDCLRSIKLRAGEIFVVDGGSTDRTVEIAQKYGAKVVQSPIRKISDLKNWALDSLPFSYDWVLILDADERVTTPLWEEIADITRNDGNGQQGYYLNRRFIFYGQWMRHSWYPSWNLRLFKHRLGRYEDRTVHEHVVLKGRAGFCQNDLFHEDWRDLTHWIAKHNAYSSREAQEYAAFIDHKNSRVEDRSFLPVKLRMKRWIKEELWLRLPARSFLYFCYLYFFKLGFLEGRRGLAFCLMHAIFEQFTALKLWELKHHKTDGASHRIEAPSAFWSYENSYRRERVGKPVA